MISKRESQRIKLLNVNRLLLRMERILLESYELMLIIVDLLLDGGFHLQVSLKLIETKRPLQMVQFSQLPLSSSVDPCNTPMGGLLFQN